MRDLPERINHNHSATAVVGNYGVEQIKVLEDLEAVRLRPGMYIGGTGQDGLMHLVWEIVDNAIDEYLAGACTEIKVTMHEDNRVTVEDNGRGIPVATHPDAGINTVELVFTKLHAGGKFDTGGYKVSGGLHGVGASVVNALAEFLEVEVRRDGKRYYQKFQRGAKTCELKTIGDAPDTGTTVTFYPDSQIFSEIKYDFARLSHRLKELAYLNPGLAIQLDNRTAGIQRRFQYEGGIAAYVRELNEARKTLHDKVISFRDDSESLSVEVAMQFTDEYDENIYSFANVINTKEGGTHLMGFKTALTRTFNEYGREKKIITQDAENLDGNDIREGLTAIISVKLRNPQFEGQTKTKLGNPDVQERVSNIVREQLWLYFNNNAGEARLLLEKALRAQEARLAAKKARQLVRRKGLLSSTALPGKLADCAEKEAAKCELYIVEGDSAGGCFSGDTKVALADGRALSFRELVAEQAAGKVHFCYTVRRDGRIGLERIINARMTKANAEVVQVTLDTGEAITCTPDHLFMLRDGTYKPAIALTTADSLMPLYRKLSNTSEPGITIGGYEMVWDPRSETWLFTHLLADWYNRWRGVYVETDGDHCYHIDFNKLNNNPTNIRRLPSDEHLALHREHISRTLHRPEVIEQCREIRRSEAFQAMMSERMRQLETRHRLSEQAKAQWKDETYKAYMAEKWREFETTQGELDLDAYRTHRLATRDKSLLRFDTFCQRYFASDEAQAHEAIANYNHRVVSVERLEERVDVYDIEVPGTHNFALASGVFVHNSAKQGRNREFQAILPLRGKVLNVEKAAFNKLLDNKELNAFITALGTSIREEFDLERLRYHKVILMCDADIDGAHIRTLLLTFLFRNLKQLIEQGYVYIAKPPLYQVKKGRQLHYLYSDEELKSLRGQDGSNWEVKRYKGLGEMNPEELWQTTMNPEKRILKQVSINDALEAEELFKVLMGSEVVPRRDFILENSDTTTNLDI